METSTGKVKRETVEEEEEDHQTRHHVPETQNVFEEGEGDEEVTLAQLSQTPHQKDNTQNPQMTSLSTGRVKKAMQKKDLVFKIKRKYTDSKVKHVCMDNKNVQRKLITPSWSMQALFNTTDKLGADMPYFHKRIGMGLVSSYKTPNNVSPKEGGMLFEHLVVSTPSGKLLSFKKIKATTDGSRAPGEIKSAAMIRAEEVQANLGPTYPSFIKALVRSHVGSCFWMGMPGLFCRTHLPRTDTTITLEDECGSQFNMKYLAYKTGLSAGWRQFAVAHNLTEGDVLIFQLVDTTKFKVYIVKADNLTEVDGALGLLNLDAAPTKKAESDEVPDEVPMGTTVAVASKQAKRKRPRSLPLAIVQKEKKQSSEHKSFPKLGNSTEHYENDSEDVGSEVLEGLKLYLPMVRHNDIDSLENFHISIDGEILDMEFPEDIRSKYHELCSSQNAFLHANIIKGINQKLIVGAISETVNIASCIRACRLTTSRDKFTTWDQTLEAFEILGMNVGFLRARLKHLVILAFESESAAATRRYIEAKRKRASTEEKIKKLENKLSELKEANKKFVADIESLKLKAGSYEAKFLEEVAAPW